MQLMGRRKKKSYSLLALPGSCVGLAAVWSTPKISGGSKGFPRYSLWGERRVPGSQQGPHGTPRSPGLCLGIPHSSSTTQPQLSSTCECWGNTRQRLPALRHRAWCHPGAIPVPSHPSPSPCTSMAACAVPRGCKQGTACRVRVQCAVPRTPLQPWGDAVSEAGCPGPVLVGAGRPGRAVASQGAGGSRRSPKAWACAELGAFSLAARAARTQRPCPRSGARGGLPGHEPDPRARRRGSALPEP